jgi:hypothetical protein
MVLVAGVEAGACGAYEADNMMDRPHDKSTQPTPGLRLGFNRAPLARHGWPHRWAVRPARQ